MKETTMQIETRGSRRSVRQEEYQDKTCKLHTKFGKMEGKTTRRKHLDIRTRFQEDRRTEVPEFKFEARRARPTNEPVDSVKDFMDWTLSH